MENDKFLSLLGLAKKAGKAVLGYDKIKASGRSYGLILISSDASERTVRNAKLYVSSDGIAAETGYTMAQLGEALGVEKVGVAAVDDRGFIESLLDALRLK